MNFSGAGIRCCGSSVQRPRVQLPNLETMISEFRPQPVLSTKRLGLRSFSVADAAAVQHLAGDRKVAVSTLSIPHPYPDGLAENWIRTHPRDFERKKAVTFAITLANQTLCGAIGLGLVPEFDLAELGYWIGVPYWGHGYCTEAAEAIVAYGFETLKLHRIQSTHFSDNPASGRVMQKLGMSYEGCRRQHTLKWGEFKDITLYGLLYEDWISANHAK